MNFSVRYVVSGSFLILAMLFLSSSCSNTEKEKLVWKDNFDDNQPFNTDYWSKIPRGSSDWNNLMSTADTLYSLNDGNLILRGMKNDFIAKDTAQYITGGVYTKDKISFGRGRWEIRAKLHGGKGLWPAFWLMPENPEKGWPNEGEIDIMERLNHDSKVYQTAHSAYTEKLGIKDNPPHSTRAEINPDEFNTYAVEIH